MAEVKQDNRMVRYFKETRAELKKVNWPTRREARNLTLLVLGMTIAFAILLGVIFDPLALWLFRGILVEHDALRIIIGLVAAVAGLVALVVGLRRQ